MARAQDGDEIVVGRYRLHFVVATAGRAAPPDRSAEATG